MNSVMILLRLIHIVCGVFWAGALIFIATFLEPSVRAVGPEGGRVMLAIIRRRYLDIMPAIALLTILSGLAMMWKVSGGFSPEWMRSRYAMTLSLGASFALLAFIIGVFALRPAALRVSRLGPAMAQLPDGPAKDAQQAELAALRARMGGLGRWVAAFLALAVCAMAVARYIG